MEKLNDFERALVYSLVDKYPNVTSHLPFLKVTSRENTGVGMLVNLEYTATDQLAPLGANSGAISSNVNIRIPGLRFGLGFEVAISDLLFKFIEIITYGEIWDGKTEGFVIVKGDM